MKTNAKEKKRGARISLRKSLLDSSYQQAPLKIMQRVKNQVFPRIVKLVYLISQEQNQCRICLIHPILKEIKTDQSKVTILSIRHLMIVLSD